MWKDIGLVFHVGYFAHLLNVSGGMFSGRYAYYTYYMQYKRCIINGNGKSHGGLWKAGLRLFFSDCQALLLSVCK